MKIQNLKEFLAHVGGDNAYQAGRALYKNTDCGPWIVYLVEEQPSRPSTLEVTVRLKDGKLFAQCEESLFDYENDLAADVLSCLGFNADGTPCRGDKIGRSLDGYRKKVEAFLAREDRYSPKGTIGDSRNPYKVELLPHEVPELGCKRGCKTVRTLLSKTLPQEFREVYYESDEANTLTECAGIKMGSIVEGSEAYVDRDPLMFPFTGEEFDAYVKSINDEACFCWNRDNLDHYMVRHGKKEYYIESGWGHDLKLPEKLRPIVTEFIQKNDLEEGQTVTIPATKIEIEKISTDGLSC